MFKDTLLINIYAHSGAENSHDGEAFFTNESTYLLPSNSTKTLLAVGFNCVVSPNDCTGKPNLSKALLPLIKDMALHDVWESQAQKPTYTHYTKDGATRLDRIYNTLQKT